MASPVNSNNGVAARNGTTSHTVSFGFTSTAGNLLVFVCAGAMTHAATGWLERLSPVSSAELSLFTKVSTGDTSITVTHNGSNYPMAWAVWEWPANTAWVGGASESANDLTFPTLSNLPGNGEIELGAALCIGVGDPGTGPSASWTAGSEGWTELIDSFTAGNSTDGVYFTVATASDATVTSTTPAGTFSPIDNPPIPAADRQKIVWALHVPGDLPYGGTPVETTLASAQSWSVNMPSGTNDVIVLIGLMDDDIVLDTLPSGWQGLGAGNFETSVGTGDEGSLLLFWREGNTASSVTFGITSGNEAGRALAIPIFNADLSAYEISTATQGADAVPDPPAAVMTGGSKKWLVLPVWALGDGDITVTTPSAGYYQATYAGGNAVGGVFYQERAFDPAVSSENPGTSPISGIRRWVAVTIAIPPATAAAPGRVPRRRVVAAPRRPIRSRYSTFGG